jgi:hypothetical protein
MAPRYSSKSETKSVDESFTFELSDADQKLLDRLESHLEIDEHALDEALQDQAQHFYEVSKNLNLLSSRRDAAKQYLKELESRVYLSIKDDARVEEAKISEKELEHRCNIHPKIVMQTETLLRLSHAVGVFAALKDAFIQRNYMAKEMAGLYVANYFTSESTTGGDVSRIKDRYASEAREAMNKARRKA